MTAPRLSVIMPVFNAQTHISAALDSLFAQTEPMFEIIVIDDGSTDATAEIARGYESDDWPRLRLIRQENMGVSGARNVGMQAAEAPILGFLDADDTWAPSKIARHLDVLDAAPEVDISFSSFGYIDDDGTPLIDHSILSEGRYGLTDLMPRNFIHTSTVVARREPLLAAGGFDTTLSTYEDFDLWLRIASANCRNLYALEDVLASYRRHDTQATSHWQKMHDGWKRVAERLARDHPAEWSTISDAAWACQYEYIASLAYNAGDIVNMRQLMFKAWKAGGMELFKRTDATIMLGIAISSYLPRWMQICIGWSFNQMRLLRRRMWREPGGLQL